ncbi:MAG: exodeoxyribonuclease VII small subunit [Desulfobacteraceae bacterium 4572_87]|nr:MAG: exodeoxyribonuclease VII small subunit [Desulfobacteraceae bacterium 4572_87]
MTEKNFEAAMHRLEKIVQSLEGGEMPLGKSLEVFEEGMQLAAYCSGELETAEKKVSLLVQESGGKYRETPFRSGGENNGE